jgi:tyrosinase
MTFTRKNAWDLGAPWPPEVLWYARAVKVMKAKKAADPLSWRFWGGIHGYDAQVWKHMGQAVAAADMPTKADFDKFWIQCQHGSWYFLPWHRGYLWAFEKVVRAAMAAYVLPAKAASADLPKDWALPYWNYFKPNQANLPDAFGSPDWPDGTGDNPLYETERWGPDDNGKVYIPLTGPNAVEENGSLGEPVFAGVADGGSAGFGGPETDHFANHDPTHGILETQPHDWVHGNVGGGNKTGLMSDPRSAGLDPIFWLHHANIDRLWEVWKALPWAQGDPTDPKWTGGPAYFRKRPFVMPSPDGSTWTYTPGDMADLKSLDYVYDDVAPPAGLAPPTHRLQALGAQPDRAAALLNEVIAMPRTVELLGASDVGLRLQGGEISTRVALQAAPRARLAANLSAVPDAAPDRVFLNLENVRAARDGGVLTVYINLPAGANPAGHPELRAGSVALFGAAQASEPDGGHAGEGLTLSLEISSLVDRLHLSGALDAGQLNVRVIARSPALDDAQISIGRIGVYRQQG